MTGNPIDLIFKNGLLKETKHYDFDPTLLPPLERLAKMKEEENNKLINQQDNSTELKIVGDENNKFIKVEEYPEPIGGMKSIQEKVIYPEIAKRANVQGVVVVSATVDEKGNVSKTKIVKGIGAGCDEAAQIAVKKTKFKPARQNGTTVKVVVNIPVSFKLEKY